MAKGLKYGERLQEAVQKRQVAPCVEIQIQGPMQNRNRPIGDVIKDYMDWARTSGGRGGRAWDEQNARLKQKSLDYWVAELGLTVLADIDLTRVEKQIQTMLAGELSAKSVALRVEALKSLIYWSIRRGLLSSNPLAGMAKMDITPKEPHRPLTDKEVAGLLNAAPAHRRLWYEVALATGFRVNELRCLRVRDLDLFGPSLFLAADFSKDRKDHRQPVPRDLADKLKALTAGREPDERLLGIGARNAPEQIAADYTKGGVTITTTEGKATWHSLRKTFINNLVKGGNDLKTIMTLARHSTAKMTMETYAQADQTLLRNAAEAATDKVLKAVLNAASCQSVAAKVVGAEGLAETVDGKMVCVNAAKNEGWFDPSRAHHFEMHLPRFRPGKNRGGLIS
jgi:integrase/recombinase XerC